MKNIFKISSFLIFSLVCISSAAKETPGFVINQEMQAKIEKKWTEVAKGNQDIYWEYVVTPGFPAKWPDDKDKTEYYYVYARGRDIKGGLIDAERVSMPWARIEVSPGAQRFVKMSEGIEKIGVQGVRPLNKDEVKIIDEHKKRRRQGGSLYQKDYYCFWLSTNGVIAENIRPRHENFFNWLGCR